MAQRVSLSSGPKGHIGAFNSVKGSTRVNIHSTRFSPTVHRALSVDSIAELGKEIRQEFVSRIGPRGPRQTPGLSGQRCHLTEARQRY